MYRDSDGYILIDMGAADISKSTQSIVGFYDRIVESVNANKLVLVINFGTYSPMPAIAHKKLNYYEIVTNLYKITINSNDIVIIEETGESTVDVSIVPTLQEGVKIADFAIGEVEGSIYAPKQVDVINDNVTASNTTWSSDKIDTELDKKADSSSLATVATSGSYNDLTNKPTIPSDLDDLSDVTLTSPSNGQTLVYDSTSEKFVNATPPSGVTALSQLSDVSLTSPASGNSLVFDGTEWANDTLAAADIPYSAGVSVADKIDSLSYTEGSSGVWHYKKYDNGIMEMWGYSSQTMQPQVNAWGSWYACEIASLGSYPVAFTALHSIVGTVTITSASGFGEIKEDITSLTTAPTYIFARPTTLGVENRTVVRTLYVRGTWK